jgi:Nif-specific regulatory protein
MVKRFAPYRTIALITGESGSGKDLVARALHDLGPSSQGPFVSFNCANLMDGLAESQLFGHVRGAFTHAREENPGCFRQANGGTLLLDEIGELPLAMQAKLLRVCDRMEIQPIGSTTPIALNVRLVAATNRDLPSMAARGDFRADLFYRLNLALIPLPPLRSRSEDIPALIAHFADQQNRSCGKSVQYISRKALDVLLAYQWPGNIRELAHVIEYAVLLGDGKCIEIGSLPPQLIQLEDRAQLDTSILSNNGLVGSKTLHNVLKHTIEELLMQTQGDCAAAARILGISKPSIYRKIARFGISKHSNRQFRGNSIFSSRLNVTR